MAQQAVATAIAADVDRRDLTRIVSSTLLDIRAQVWPDAPPARLPDDGSAHRP